MVLHDALCGSDVELASPAMHLRGVALLNTLAPWAGQGASDTNSDIK